MRSFNTSTHQPTDKCYSPWDDFSLVRMGVCGNCGVLETGALNIHVCNTINNCWRLWIGTKWNVWSQQLGRNGETLSNYTEQWSNFPFRTSKVKQQIIWSSAVPFSLEKLSDTFWANVYCIEPQNFFKKKVFSEHRWAPNCKTPCTDCVVEFIETMTTENMLHPLRHPTPRICIICIIRHNLLFDQREPKKFEKYVIQSLILNKTEDWFLRSNHHYHHNSRTTTRTTHSHWRSPCQECDFDTRKNEMINKKNGTIKQQHVRAGSPSAKWQQTKITMAMNPAVEVRHGQGDLLCRKMRRVT